MERLIWEVKDIIRETASTSTFVLVNKDRQRIPYEAGQFLTFIFKRKDTEIRRSYSISSAPGIDEDVSITVKRVPNGEISRWLVDEVSLHDQLISIPPAGRFVLGNSPRRNGKYFFIAAGSGIVPVFSLIKQILYEEPSAYVVLIYQNHNEHDIIFNQQLTTLREKFSSTFKWISFLSHPADSKYPLRKINNMMLEKLLIEHGASGISPIFYLCGPVSFMRMAAFTLKWMGFSDDQIRKENFVIDFYPPPPPLTDETPKMVTLHIHQQIFQLWVKYPKTILQAALENHLPIPYSCQSGSCGSCAAKCLKGNVRMSNNEVLTDQDLLRGMVLTCVGYPLNEVELEC